MDAVKRSPVRCELLYSMMENELKPPGDFHKNAALFVGNHQLLYARFDCRPQALVH